MTARAPRDEYARADVRSLVKGIPLDRRLLQFFEAQLPGASALAISNLTRVSGGNVRWAFAFDVSWNQRGVAHRRNCVLLLKAEPGQLDTHLACEVQVLRALENSPVPVPAVLWVDLAGTWLGGPSVILQQMTGASDIKALMAPSSAGSSASVTRDLAQVAAKLHSLNWREYHLSEIPTTTTDDAAVTQVMFWEQLFHRNRMEPLPVLDFAFHWLKSHAPPAQRVSLLHGDLRFGNFLYEQDRITAVLDWEMAHLGDPIEDIAWAYRPLWSPQQHVPLQEFIVLYSSLSGIEVPPATLHFYRMFSEIKHAVISLCAARAFAEGSNRSVRNADRMAMVPGLLLQFFEWAEAG